MLDAEGKEIHLGMLLAFLPSRYLAHGSRFMMTNNVAKYITHDSTI